MQHSALINVMLTCAKKASARMLRDFHELRFMQDTKRSMHKFIGFTASNAEDAIFEALHKARPEFGLIAKHRGILAKHNDEFLKERGLPVGVRRYWLINVLDGAENLARAMPHFAISIAVKQLADRVEISNASEGNGEIVAGIVYAPALGEIYCAEKGSGAWCEFSDEDRAGQAETRLRVSQQDKARPIVITNDASLASSAAGNKSGQLDIGGTAVRILGSSSISLAYLAAGRADRCILRYDPHADEVDLAAGIIIAREAGAIVSSEKLGEDGKERLLIAANPVSAG